MPNWMILLLLNGVLRTRTPLFPLPQTSLPIPPHEAVSMALKAATGKSLFRQYLIVNRKTLKDGSAEVRFYSVDPQGMTKATGRVLMTKSEGKMSIEMSGFPETKHPATLDEYDLSAIEAYDYLTTKKALPDDFGVWIRKASPSEKNGEAYTVCFERIPPQFEAVWLVSVKVTLGVSGL